MILSLLAVLIQALNGAPVDALQTPTGASAIVYIFTTTDCPISNRYAPEIQRLARTFGPKGVVFRLVYPGRADDDKAIRTHLEAFAYQGMTEAVRDPQLALAKHAGATITPEAVVVVKGEVVYRGRIDDRYVEIGVERAAPATHDLADALAAALAGKPIAHRVTQAVGCFIADLAR